VTVSSISMFVTIKNGCMDSQKFTASTHEIIVYIYIHVVRLLPNCPFVVRTIDTYVCVHPFSLHLKYCYCYFTITACVTLHRWWKSCLVQFVTW